MSELSKCGCPARSNPLPRIIGLLAFACVLLVFWLSGGAEYFSLHELATHREALRAWVEANFFAAIALYMIVYATAVALSLPVAAPMTLAGGFLFGWLIGGVVTVAAATAGALVLFVLVRGMLAEWVARRAGPRLEKLRCGLQQGALGYLLFLRLVPVFPFWLVNLAPPALGVHFRDFAIATFIGIMPITFALSLTGSGLESTLAEHQRAYLACAEQNPVATTCSIDFSVANLLTPELLFASAAIGVIALLSAIAKRVWNRRYCGE